MRSHELLFINCMKNYLVVYLKGLAMGAADVVPGVSGGTIAFISGIYERLLNAIKSINLRALQILFKDGIKAAWAHIDGTFLVSLLAGILTSVFSLAKGLGWALHHYPQLLWSFFFGLVLASAVFVAQDITKTAKAANQQAWTPATIVSFIIGAAIAYIITILSPSEAPITGGAIDYLIFFGAGSIAICAMILPGISGSFILLLMGMYSLVLQAVTQFNIPILFCFAAGCGIGLMAFSHVLTWLFQHYRAVAMAMLTGFMIGSLNKVWPWQNVIATRTNSKGEVEPFLYENVLPNDYFHVAEAAKEAYLFPCLALAVVGFVIVFAIERLSKSIAPQE